MERSGLGQHFHRRKSRVMYVKSSHEYETKTPMICVRYFQTMSYAETKAEHSVCARLKILQILRVHKNLTLPQQKKFSFHPVRIYNSNSIKTMQLNAY